MNETKVRNNDGVWFNIVGHCLACGNPIFCRSPGSKTADSSSQDTPPEITRSCKCVH